MSFMRASSPYAHSALTTGALMRQVLLALVPGALALTVFFGIGVLINLLLATLAALILEAGALALRHRPVVGGLSDGSALVTAVLLGLALPPYCPWWLVLIGVFFAIVIAKHFYGGLGYNPFNPAMVGYAVLLVSFPLQMSQWIPPGEVVALPDLADALNAVFGGGSGLGADGSVPGADGSVPGAEGSAPGGNGSLLGGYALDGYSSATPLDALRNRGSQTLADLYRTDPLLQQGRWAGAGWEWVNFAFLGGGLYLIYRKIFSWHAPVAMLGCLGLLALLGYDSGSSDSAGSPLFHWLSGATMLGAFFIVTDPVTSATSKRGRLIFGAGVGALVFVLRTWGGYPDGLAFAVLLMNLAVPCIDYYTVPRTYGHSKPPRTIFKRPS